MQGVLDPEKWIKTRHLSAIHPPPYRTSYPPSIYHSLREILYLHHGKGLHALVVWSDLFSESGLKFSHKTVDS